MIMKKTYQVPEIEVTMMETAELMQASMAVFETTVGGPFTLSRDGELNFNFNVDFEVEE